MSQSFPKVMESKTCFDKSNGFDIEFDSICGAVEKEVTAAPSSSMRKQ